jgi:hypothetical protein
MPDAKTEGGWGREKAERRWRLDRMDRMDGIVGKKEGVALQGYIRLIQVQMKMKEEGREDKKPVSARPEGDSLDMPLKKLTYGGHRLFERAAIRKVDVPVHFSSATPIEFS